MQRETRTQGWFTTALVTAGLTLLTGLVAEAAARVDDYLRDQVPVLANPDSDASLKIFHGGMMRGRPNGRFKKWRLDANGFREITAAQQANPRCGKVLVMGASETFGQFESPNKDYPSQLQQQLLRSGGCARVINTAVVGMSLSTMHQYWTQVLAQEDSAVVVLYPSTHFYADPELLAEGQARARRARPEDRMAAREPLRSRFIDRLRDRISLPTFVQRRRNANAIASAIAARPQKPLQTTASATGLEMLRADLASLVEAIQASGAQVILVVPGHRATQPPRASDLSDLTDMRRFSPHVPEAVLLQFVASSTNIVRQVAVSTGATAVDADRMLSGCRDCFGDLVHLTDLGAEKIAALLSGAVEQTLELRNARAL